MRLVPKRLKGDRDHARNVAWRIVKACLEAQLTMAALGQAKVEEVLLPWMTDGRGTTLFAYMEQAQYQGLLEHRPGGENG